MNSRLLLVASAVAASACARSYAELSPAVGSVPASGPGEGAVANVAGIQIVARTQAWHFDPPNLEEKATPMMIEIANNSDRSIVLHYKDITLTDESGARYDVIPPYSVTGTLSVPVTIQDPYYYSGGYAFSPYVHRWSPIYASYHGAFAYDPQYYYASQPYVTIYTDVALPTAEMVSRALPETAIDPGSTVGGFVYFKRFRRGERIMNLRVDLVDQASGQLLGTARIPFIAN